MTDLTLWSGRLLRDKGMARVEENEDTRWVNAATMWVDMLPPGTVFTAEDLCSIGRPRRPNSVGARLNALAKQGLIAPAGFVQATRKERHASRMLSWRRV